MPDIPFQVRGSSGRIRVVYGVNSDPERWGFHLLDLPFDISRVEGFPIFQATIDYGGSGYHGYMGWIQVVTVTETSGESWASVDVAPMLWESDSPFAAFGYLPGMFDAPGPNPPRSDETWVAETFLAVVPDIARTRRVRAVCGLRWGYDLQRASATPRPLETASEADWGRCVGVLREAYPSWEFAAGFAAD